MIDKDFVCRIDSVDKISFVNDAWASFAVANGASHLPALAPGTSLFDHIFGMPVRQVYRDLVQRVRESGVEVSFPFRCDSPDLRRYLEMCIVPLPGDEVEFRSRIIREEQRTPPVFTTESGRCHPQQIAMCSWCKKIAAPDWVEVEVAVGKLGLIEGADQPLISHGMCPECWWRVDPGSSPPHLEQAS